ncbi:MotA/TolQ/ExbB proton channel family protein [Rhizobium ruizarguesonis]
MLHIIYAVVETESGGHVTDGLPRVGFRTLLVAIALALVIAFGGHYLLKQWTRASAFSGNTLQQLKATTKLPKDLDVASAILESPLYVNIPQLEIIEAAPTPDYLSPSPAMSFTERADSALFLPHSIASYFSTDIAAVQVYLYFVGSCTEAGVALQECQKSLLKESYDIVSKLKHNPIYILYRLEGGYIQLIATYIFALGILVLALREFRAAQINGHLRSREAGMRFAREQLRGDELLSLSFRATLRAWWAKRIEEDKGVGMVNVEQQLERFGMVAYEPEWREEESLAMVRSRASLLRKFHLYLASALREQHEMTAAERFRGVLPRTILKVITAFVVDQGQFPQTGRERAGEALEHSVDELAATIAADRDLYSRLVELTPVVGFFGTVWGLSLAMLGANDVIRAQGSGWNYVVANNTTYITEALKAVEEKQQFALSGMLSALSIKFDTTGFALILMFLLILFGAHAARREYRSLSLLHSIVTETILSVLPTFGSIETDIPTLDDRSAPPPVRHVEQAK